jgi:hypothetical protein
VRSLVGARALAREALDRELLGLERGGRPRLGCRISSEEMVAEERGRGGQDEQLSTRELHG